MRRFIWIAGTGAIALVAAVTLSAVAQNNSQTFMATLNGYEEVPAISTEASGTFRAKVSQSGDAIDYILAYDGLAGDVMQAHIHFGQPGVSGGVMIWLCGTEALPGPDETPVCPQSGTVESSVDASDVVGPAGQGISAGEFAEALRAIRSGVAYANVHSTVFPPGEIRGRIQ